MKYAYDPSYDPPAPSIEVWLAATERAFTVGPLRAFIDTGADATLAPARFIDQLGVDAFDIKRLRSQWREARFVKTYLVDIGIGNLRLPLVELVGDELSSELLLGRDVLNALRMTLDGPKQIVGVRE